MKIQFKSRKGEDKEMEILTVSFVHGDGIAYFETADQTYEIDIIRIKRILM